MEYTITKGLRKKVQYNCPSCKSDLESKLEEVGSKDTCPICNYEFTVPGEKPPPLKSKAVVPPKPVPPTKTPIVYVAPEICPVYSFKGTQLVMEGGALDMGMLTGIANWSSHTLGKRTQFYSPASHVRAVIIGLVIVVILGASLVPFLITVNHYPSTWQSREQKDNILLATILAIGWFIAMAALMWAFIYSKSEHTITENRPLHHVSLLLPMDKCLDLTFTDERKAFRFLEELAQAGCPVSQLISQTQLKQHLVGLQSQVSRMQAQQTTTNTLLLLDLLR